MTDTGACCTRESGHAGPCEWICYACNGTGRCLECDEVCNCDDVVTCEWCDGSHACPHCYDGVTVDG